MNRFEPWQDFETVIGEGVPTTDELISAHFANDAIMNAMAGVTREEVRISDTLCPWIEGEPLIPVLEIAEARKINPDSQEVALWDSAIAKTADDIIHSLLKVKQ